MQQVVEPDVGARGVLKAQTSRHAVAQVLDDVDVLQRGQWLGAPLREHHLGRGVRGARQQQRAQRHGRGSANEAALLHFGAPSGKAPPATSSIAFSIGMCAMPLLRSIQP